MAEWLRDSLPATAIAIDSRGLQYGDGLFETVALRGGEPRLWKLHRQRLLRGCARLGLAPPDADRLHEDMCRLAEGGYDIGKVVVSARSRGRGYARSAGATDVLLRGYLAASLPAHYYRDGIRTTMCNTRLAMGGPLAGLKTLNRLEQVLARNEIQDSNHFEGFTRGADGDIICGTMSNVFTVSDNVICTPPVDRCGVAGVMREYVMRRLADVDMAVEVASLASFEAADEVFVTNSQFGILPVRHCDERRFEVGTITRRVMKVLGDSGIEECRL